MTNEKEEREFQLEKLRVQIGHQDVLSLLVMFIAILFSAMISLAMTYTNFFFISGNLNWVFNVLMVLVLCTIAIFATVRHYLSSLNLKKEFQKIREKFIDKKPVEKEEPKKTVGSQILSKLEAMEKRMETMEASLKRFSVSSTLTTEDQLFFGIVFTLFVFFLQFPEFDLCTVFENFDVTVEPAKGILTTKMVLILFLVISSGARYLTALTKDDTKRNTWRMVSVSFLLSCFYFLAFDLTIRGLTAYLKNINVFLIFLSPVALSVISIVIGHLVEKKWLRAYGYDQANISIIFGYLGVTILIAYYIGMVTSLFIPITDLVSAIILLSSIFFTYLTMRFSNHLNKRLRHMP